MKTLDVYSIAFVRRHSNASICSVQYRVYYVAITIEIKLKYNRNETAFYFSFISVFFSGTIRHY